MHHIVSDGWSLGIFARELAALYEEYAQGRAHSLPDLPIQYADYAFWQRQWLEGETLARQLAYWKEHLLGAPLVLELPTERARPRVQSYRGGSVPVVLDESLSRAVKQLARQEGMTLFMVLYAGFAVLLSRLSGQSDLVVGVPVANRQRTEVEGLIGFFVNTLPLRVRLEEGMNVRALLRQVKANTLGGYSHQDVPFEEIVKLLQPQRSLSHSPLFQVMVALQSFASEFKRQRQPSGLSISAEPLFTQRTQFDLNLSLEDVGARIEGTLHYATDLFERSTIERWVSYLQRMFQEMARDVEQPVGSLTLLGDAERRQVIEEFNATAAQYPADRLIHELFEAQVKRTPHAAAVIYEDQVVSYAELNARANRLAHYLRAQGVGPDRLVGLCVERSLEMVVGLLGILKAGGAYVPLDPGYPPERLQYMIDDATPGVLLTQDRLMNALRMIGAAWVSLDGDWSVIAAQPATDIDVAQIGAKPDHLAYVIYTSGSTGTPKGAMNEHRAVVNRLEWMQRRYQLGERDRVLQKTPFSFDVSVWEFFWPLLHGAKLVLARPGGHRDPLYLAELIEDKDITTLHFVPSMLQSFMSQFPEGRCASLRQIMCSGEELPATLEAQVLKRLPRLRLHNLYGPTEAAVDVTSWECVGGFERVPIGKPISNIRIYVLDAHRQPVPIGAAGEIYIGGVGVGRGYLNRVELTAERFLQDPFSATADARMYRTGDLGRWRADGNIEFLGRNDFQVKIRGLRIELGEIEAKLSGCDGVKEAVVLALEGAHADEPGERRLVAYVTAQNGAPLSPTRLRGELLKVLADYMVPSAFVVLESLPLSPNGKLDRKALPTPDEAAVVSKEYAAPVGRTEESLASIWQELLRVERVSRHDNFFDLGGHSLLAVQLVSRMRQTLGYEVALRDVFMSSSLMSLGEHISLLDWAQRSYLNRASEPLGERERVSI
jgi:amino acid adenylation domain-containing protein